MVVRREMSFMKKKCRLHNQKKWGVQNKMRFKKKMNNNWALRRKKIGVKPKNLVAWNIRKQMHYK